METASFFQELSRNGISCIRNEPMSRHTTFKIGGCADYFVQPESKEELIFVLKAARRYGIPVFILGNGSNILVSDGGIDGAVVSLLGMDRIVTYKNGIVCECGAKLSAVCTAAQQSGLTGLEFAYGIPGSAGGALYMNAGAYGGDMSQVIKGAYCLDENLREIYLKKSEMELSYRSSIFKNGLIITKLIFSLGPGDKDEIMNKMRELLGRRKDKQPLEYPSAGSTFKRPDGYFAGALIEKNGLKGCSVGGAMVSEKHAGFIINYNNAAAGDVRALIETVRKTVMEGDGVMLEPEVIFVGRE